MTQTVILDLPEDTLARYRKGAEAARKPLEEFLVDRLKEAAPPYTTAMAIRGDERLDEFNQLSDEVLWKIAQQRLTGTQQREYELLLEKNRTAKLTSPEQKTITELGNQARQLTLRKAHAYMILKWRGYEVPLSDAIQEKE